MRLRSRSGHSSSSASFHDPEQVLEVYEALVPVQSMLGRFAEARDVSILHAEATERLDPASPPSRCGRQG